MGQGVGKTKPFGEKVDRNELEKGSRALIAGMNFKEEIVERDRGLEERDKCVGLQERGGRKERRSEQVSIR